MSQLRVLPGIRFETEPPPLESTLPRMDVAGFVGFASKGPFHQPIAVEDIKAFRQRFGEDDEPLALDSGQSVYPYLGPAVEAFFQNGGRRCWVARVEECETLQAADFLDERYSDVGLYALAEQLRRNNYQTGTLLLFSVPLGSEGSLDSGKISADLRNAFEENDVPLAENGSVTVIDVGVKWRIHDGIERFEVTKTGTLNIYGSPPRGIYSLFSIEEITILAVPDAVHPGWSRVTLPPLQIPKSPEIKTLDVTGQARKIDWSSVSPDINYELQESVTADFKSPRDVYSGPNLEILLESETGCVTRLYYRVRAIKVDKPGPWSRTRSAIVPESDFLACEENPLPAPKLKMDLIGSPADIPLLRWDPVPDATDYTLEAALDPAFDSAYELVPERPFPQFKLQPIPAVVTYFRVRAIRNSVVGPWSNTIFQVPPPKTEKVLNQPANSSELIEHLLRVHRAVLRFCAARGDVMAILGLPRFYRREQAELHVQALRSVTSHPGGPVAKSDESRTLSYGALCHPWLGATSESRPDEGSIFRPPHGVVCGMLARRALADGVWYQPANLVAEGVVALDPPLSRDDWKHLSQQHVNLFRPDPRGFVSWVTLTLSRDIYLGARLSSGLPNGNWASSGGQVGEPISTRRLLMLLRRLMLREGHAHVFESNTARLRRQVRLRFEEVLGRLFERGAFSGSVPSQGFRVATDSTINPPESIDRGRLIVELQIAPSHPLEFITVRLVQRDAGPLFVEEF